MSDNVTKPAGLATGRATYAELPCIPWDSYQWGTYDLASMVGDALRENTETRARHEGHIFTHAEHHFEIGNYYYRPRTEERESASNVFQSAPQRGRGLARGSAPDDAGFSPTSPSDNAGLSSWVPLNSEPAQPDVRQAGSGTAASTELPHLQQRENESIQEFGERVDFTLRNADRHQLVYSEEDAMRIFLGGLCSSEVAIFTSSERPRTLREACEIAREEARFFESQDLSSCQDDLQYEATEMDDAFPASTCGFCGKPGHRQNACRKLRRTNKTSAAEAPRAASCHTRNRLKRSASDSGTAPRFQRHCK